MNNFIGEKVLVRGCNSGVYFGTLAEKEGQEVLLKDARNLWYYSGANNILELATNGVKRPGECKFSHVVDSIELTDICEIVPCTPKAIEIIEKVRVWEVK